MNNNWPSSRSSGSVRHASRPVVRRPSFRDDTNLVAIRYEKTTQGEAPIPMLTRRPSRSSRPVSSSSSTSYRPIIVVPPSATLAHAQAPPTEEHPALRQGPVLQWTGPATGADASWKRDSGHAPASCPSTTPTINEEDCEHDFPPYSPSIGAVSPVVRPVQDTCPADQETVDTGDSPAYLYDPKSTNALPVSDQGARLDDIANTDNGVEASPFGLTRSSFVTEQPRPQTPLSTPSSPLFSLPAEASRQTKIAKSFSFRSVASSLMRADSRTTRGSGRGEERSENDIEQMEGPGEAFSAITGRKSTSTAPRAPLMRGPLSPKPTDKRTAAWEDHARPLKSEQTKTPSRNATISAFFKRSPFHPTSSQRRRRHTKSEADNAQIFSPLSVAIPTDSLLDDDFMNGLSFSKRGSVMFGGQRALSLDYAIMNTTTDQANAPLSTEGVDNGANSKAVATTPGIDTEAIPASTSAARSSSESSNTGYVTPDAEPTPSARPAEDQIQQPTKQIQQSAPAPTPSIRVMPADIDRESQKVRSLYLVGDASDLENGPRPSLGERREPPLEEVTEEDDKTEPSPQLASQLRAASGTVSVDSSSLLQPDTSRKEAKLVGGGFEDWDDLDGAVVDRYGFITNPRPSSSRLGTPTETRSAHSQYRRRNVLQKKHGLSASSAMGGDARPPSRKVSARSLNTHHSGLSTTSLRSSRSVMRQAGNLLPHNRDRRWVDEAADMLSSSPSLQDIAEEARMEKITEALKRKEWERAEKWRRMAKIVKKGAQGEGMEFEFDAKNPKLIERTWKGIPDRWRASAWWSFMATSAKAKEGSPTETEIVADFHKLQEENCTDDVQIDLDVPRTISRHIMFRRRYEGGQRLLFRVLHALSIYFPETGYVQGMASLAATLLCYFDEEKCFVMLVRMWRLRGLDRLYAHGFEGLMTALHEFETIWLNKDVARKLNDLGIDATAYGTRWYLTLFNLSIPFAAQLRVWDVFLLLGTSTSIPTPVAKSIDSSKAGTEDKAPAPKAEPTGLDILHATSAALIQALREVLVDSDFENAMKSLTSSIAIRDEDLLMRVSKAEWKSHQGKRKA